MTNSRRLGVQPGEVIDRTRPVRFRWNGKRIEGFTGDTIVSALLANDHRILSRSMKYHRPRGVMTADYWDPNTTVQVGTEPNVQSAYSIETFAWDQDGNLLIKTYYPMPENVGADSDPYAHLLESQ